ncbi:MAG: hypothetical protein OXI90_15445 [Gammaproteobacteria bacterium]|nr:hypothetical protein [Gammaproteobacteria bacterium]
MQHHPYLESKALTGVPKVTANLAVPPNRWRKQLKRAYEWAKLFLTTERMLERLAELIHHLGLFRDPVVLLKRKSE